MKTISLSVSEEDYDAFRAYAKKHDRSIAELVREAMRLYRERLGSLSRLETLVVLDSAPLEPLPSRAEFYDELGERHF